MQPLFLEYEMSVGQNRYGRRGEKGFTQYAGYVGWLFIKYQAIYTNCEVYGWTDSVNEYISPYLKYMNKF